jgi:hypothetical protein
MGNTIVFIPMEKDGDGKVVERYRIIIYGKAHKNTDVDGMSNRIGEVVNKITKLWSLPQTEMVKDTLKDECCWFAYHRLCEDWNQSRDSDEIEEFLEEVKKPYFIEIH